jgi:uncharacterized iron-regulated protein
MPYMDRQMQAERNGRMKMNTCRMQIGRTLLFAATLSAATPIATNASDPGETGLLHLDHPLVGSVWSSRDGRTMTTEETHDRLAQADVAILGETHDNTEHHRLQARIIGELAARDRQPAIVFEMIPQDLQDAVDMHLREHPGDAEGLGRATQWDARGWPDWRIYQPIADVAVRNGLAIRAGGLSKVLQRRLMQEGADALSDEERARLGLDHDLSPEAASSLDETLFLAHCELIPREALPAMRQIQWARDGAMADAIEGATQDGPAVLIAGAGHARRDWGVPAQLEARQSRLTIVSLVLVEVEPGRNDPADYLPEGAGQVPVYDLLVFTPRASRDDPCEALRDRFAPSETER